VSGIQLFVSSIASVKSRTALFSTEWTGPKGDYGMPHLLPKKVLVNPDPPPVVAITVLHLESSTAISRCRSIQRRRLPYIFLPPTAYFSVQI
jgi:hypothetical protein